MKKRNIIPLLVIAAIFISVLLLSVPQIRVNLFVRLYHSRIEEGLSMGSGVPADDAVLFGYQAVNSWNGKHPMTEFVIMSRGDSYYGCYYSPDDVPLAFQNTAADLTPAGQSRWVWTAEGDNHGTTARIMEHWYYFDASF